MVWINTIKVFYHPNDSPWYITFHFFPIDKPLWRLDCIDEGIECFSVEVPKSFNELKSPWLKKMAIQEFKDSPENLFFLLIGKRNRIWQSNAYLLTWFDGVFCG